MAFNRRELLQKVGSALVVGATFAILPKDLHVSQQAWHEDNDLERWLLNTGNSALQPNIVDFLSKRLPR